MRIDHSTLEALHHQARRERAQAVHQLLVVPIVRFFRKRPVFAPRAAPLRFRLA
jgi:hypothetical protein